MPLSLQNVCRENARKRLKGVIVLMKCWSKAPLFELESDSSSCHQNFPGASAALPRMTPVLRRCINCAKLVQEVHMVRVNVFFQLLVQS
jgi:hypothetical protein